VTPDLGQLLIDRSRELLTRDHLPRIELCLAALDDAALWWRPNEESNSVANLVLHLAGALRQYIVSGVGGVPDVRERQAEFDRREGLSRDDLLAALGDTVRDADAVLARLRPDQLGEQRRIQGRDLTVFRAVHQAVDHVTMHTGQIILLTKLLAPGAIRFWEVKDGVATPLWKRG
jgi:hypothetical protein